MLTARPYDVVLGMDYKQLQSQARLLRSHAIQLEAMTEILSGAAINMDKVNNGWKLCQQGEERGLAIMRTSIHHAHAQISDIMSDTDCANPFAMVAK